MKIHQHLIGVLLFLTVLAVGNVSVWADAFTPAANTYYKLKNVSADAYFQWQSASSAHFQFSGDLFEIATFGTGFSLKAVTGTESGTYLNVSRSNTWDIAASSTRYRWTIEEVSNGSETYYIRPNGSNYLGNTGNAHLGTGIFRGSSTTDCVWTLEAVTAVTYTFHVTGVTENVTITYNGNTYTDGGTVTTIQSITPDEVTATEVSGYTYTVTVDGTNITISYMESPSTHNPASVVALLDRIGGSGTSNQIETLVDPSMNSRQDVFTICANNDGTKPLIKGTSLSAVTAGIGYYLNHYLNVNIAWNNLNECGDGAYANLPSMAIPATAETHTCDAQYRYYLNYCTFGYSMATWSIQRWMKEIDWMALHGVNMPLAIIGLEQVWKDFLMNDLKDCGATANYTEKDAENFIPGPAFIGWWGMNNLQSWGGDTTNPAAGVHDDAWYARQVTLGQAILQRERSLGMEPVLPGFCGMVPTNFTSKTGIATESTNKWNNFDRPYILDPSGEAFPKLAAKYYERLKAVMGESRYYSMDPFHEWGTISSGKYAEGYTAVYDAMNTCCGSNTEWVIQQWDWQWYQKTSLASVPAGRLLVLDLFSDGSPAFDTYNGYSPQKAIYCIIPNFGGRSGLMGRLESVAGNYFTNKAKYSTIQGVGAAPEAIEQTPITYDLLFELPWLGSKPDIQTWVRNYAVARYGSENSSAQSAWDELRQSALAFGTDGVQGPIEDVWAARPNLSCEPASHWGKTISNVAGTYTPERRQMVIDAAYKLVDASAGLGDNKNLDYDIIEVLGQAMADYAYSLLGAINDAKTSGDKVLLYTRKNAFLQLILDMDAFKGTNTNFRLGKWTQEARNAALEATGATTATADWYEQANARTLITTWGDYATSENTPLHEYSYRSWQGMLKDYYYPRWKYYFDNNCSNPSEGWFYHDWDWAHRKKWTNGDTSKSTKALTSADAGYSYSATAEGNTVGLATELLSKYIYQEGDTYKYHYIDDDGPTAVEAIHETPSQSQDCYDLSGRKIGAQRVKSGITICNGKKQIVK